MEFCSARMHILGTESHIKSVEGQYQLIKKRRSRSVFIAKFLYISEIKFMDQ